MTALDIAAMPVLEKLQLMERLWDSLHAQTDGDLPSPAWHEHALKASQNALNSGHARFVDWNDAKNQLRKPL